MSNPDTPTIIFDLDGTLIDSVPAIHAVSNLVMGDFGYPPLSLAQVRGFVGRGVPHLVRRLLEAQEEKADAPDIAQVEAAFLARYETHVEGNTPYPGAAAALEALAARGYRLGICTNKPEGATRAALRHVRLADRFAIVVCGDTLPSRKPDPAMLFHARDLLGGGRTLFVGDSEVDAETAANAGLPFALFTEGYRKTPVEALPHSVRFSDWTDFPAIVDAGVW